MYNEQKNRTMDYMPEVARSVSRISTTRKQGKGVFFRKAAAFALSAAD